MSKIILEIELDEEELKHPRWSVGKAIKRIIRDLNSFWFVKNVEKIEEEDGGS